MAQGFCIRDTGFKVQSFEFLGRVWSLEFGVQGSGFRVYGSGLRIQGLELRVKC